MIPNKNICRSEDEVQTSVRGAYPTRCSMRTSPYTRSLHFRHDNLSSESVHKHLEQALSLLTLKGWTNVPAS
jgi:hypothetical protein